MGLTPRAVAIHEAGHAVVAHRLGIPVYGMAVDEHFGQTGIEPPPTGAERGRLERAATATLAGSVSSAIYQSVPYTFAPSIEILADETKAADLVGLIDGITAPEIDALLQELAERAGELLKDRENWTAVERLADDLLAEGVLTAPEVAAIVPLSARDDDS